MKKPVAWITTIFFVLLDIGIAFSEWRGYVRQGYQSWKQFFNPQEINSPIDASSGATPTVTESGPVTEMETLWDFEYLRGTATAGLFGRVLWYSESTYDYLFMPVIRYREPKHTVDAGRYNSETWGSGLLISTYPAGGARYANYFDKFETRIFNHAVIEYSDFQKIDTRYFGISETYRFHKGKAGFMYVYDNTNPFYDASRAEIRAMKSACMQTGQRHPTGSCKESSHMLKLRQLLPDSMYRSQSMLPSRPKPVSWDLYIIRY